jgi:hypothetical protein
MSVSDALVVLRSGLAVPVDAVRLLLELEERGIDVRVDCQGLSVGPRDRLTDDDRNAIRQHRQALISLVLLSDEEVQ